MKNDYPMVRPALPSGVKLDENIYVTSMFQRPG